MKSKELILLVVNPMSGGTEKSTLIDFVKTETENKGFAIEIYETSGNNDEQKIHDLVRKHQPSRVLVAGGDGTIQLLAKILLENDIPLGILPAGSANGFAVSQGIPETMEEQLGIALGDNLIDIDVLEINGHLCIHLADMGLNAELIKNYEQGSIRGKIGYFLHAIPSLISADYPYTFSVSTNEETYTLTGIILIIANADKFGTGALINPGGKINDGKFEIIVFKNFDIQGIIETLNGELTSETEFVDIISTDHAIITTTNNVPFQIDGEFIGDINKTVATLSAHKLRMALP